VTRYFNKKCKDKSSCRIRTKTLFPTSVCPKSTNVRLAIFATCDSRKINLFGNPKLSITTENAALTVVYMDILGVAIFWLAMIFAKPMVSLTSQEIDKTTLEAADFTVQIKNEIEDYKLDSFRPMIWKWAENINKQSK